MADVSGCCRVSTYCTAPEWSEILMACSHGFQKNGPINDPHVVFLDVRCKLTLLIRNITSFELAGIDSAYQQTGCQSDHHERNACLKRQPSCLSRAGFHDPEPKSE